MLTLPVTEAMRQDARRRLRELEAVAARTPGVMQHVSGFEARANGTLAELAVAAWLRRCGLDVEHHGGVDALPDLDVAGVALGVKFCGLNVAGGWRPRYHVDVFDRHLRSGDEWAFVGPA